MKSLLKALAHALARAIATEAGEMLSVRRKYHLLQSEIYSPAEDVARREALRQGTRPQATAFSRCTGTTRHARVVVRSTP